MVYLDKYNYMNITCNAADNIGKQFGNTRTMEHYIYDTFFSNHNIYFGMSARCGILVIFIVLAGI